MQAPPPRWTALGALAVVATAAGVLVLVRPPWEAINLREADELWFIETALQMARGQTPWLFPAEGAGMDKPPGFLWLIAASLKALGPTVYAARLPSALAVVLAALVTARIGQRTGGATAAVTAGLGLLAMPMLFLPRAGWTAVQEPALVAVMAIVLALGVSLISQREPRPRTAIALGAAIGVITLLKTAIAILPVACVVVGAVLAGRRDLLRGLLVPAGVTAAVVALAWPLACLLTGRADYLGDIWLTGGLAKIGRVIGGSGRPPLYLLRHTAAGLGAALPVVAVGLALAARAGPEETRAARRFALGVVLTNMTLFSLTSTQWPWYSVTCFPAAALCLGLAVRDAARSITAGPPAALLGGALLGLLGKQPWIRDVDLFEPDLMMLELPFMPRAGALLEASPVGALVLAIAALALTASRWPRLALPARTTVLVAAVGMVAATSGASLLRMQWTPDRRPAPPMLTLGELALAKEARGGAEDLALNSGWIRFHIDAQEARRPAEITPLTVRILGPDAAQWAVERFRPVPPLDEREAFQQVDGADGGHTVPLRLGPGEPLLYRLSRPGSPGEGLDCLRVLHLAPGAGAQEVTVRPKRLLPLSASAGLRASVHCGAERPGFPTRRHLPYPK